MALLNIIRRIKNFPTNTYRKIESKRIKKGKVNFCFDGLNRSKRDLPEIIVSLTSYPGRIDIVPGTLASLLKQTYKPDRIILWLGIDKFPNEKLPQIYDKARRAGIEIEFREDLKSHTKYFYAMLENPESIIITVDDDRIYDKSLIEKLVESYKKFPNMVSAARVHKITFDDFGNINPYNNWIYEYKNHVYTYSHKYFATGVGGVLYPPHCLHPEVFNLEIIKKCCHNHDDLWLKVMEILADTKVVIASDAKSETSYNIFDSQNSGQYIENVVNGGNDIQTKAVLDVYNNFLCREKTLVQTIREDI